MLKLPFASLFPLILLSIVQTGLGQEEIEGKPASGLDICLANIQAIENAEYLVEERRFFDGVKEISGESHGVFKEEKILYRVYLDFTGQTGQFAKWSENSATLFGDFSNHDAGPTTAEKEEWKSARLSDGELRWANSAGRFRQNKPSARLRVMEFSPFDFRGLPILGSTVGSVIEDSVAYVESLKANPSQTREDFGVERTKLEYIEPNFHGKSRAEITILLEEIGDTKRLWDTKKVDRIRTTILIDPENQMPTSQRQEFLKVNDGGVRKLDFGEERKYSWIETGSGIWLPDSYSSEERKPMSFRGKSCWGTFSKQIKITYLSVNGKTNPFSGKAFPDSQEKVWAYLKDREKNEFSNGLPDPKSAERIHLKR